MIFIFLSPSGCCSLEPSFTHQFARRREVTQRCSVRADHVPHPRQLRLVLLRGEDHQQGPRRLHGHRPHRQLRLELQNEQIARWVMISASLIAPSEVNKLLRCKFQAGTSSRTAITATTATPSAHPATDSPTAQPSPPMMSSAVAWT